MKLPNAENAVIAEDKLRDYLLNPGHRRGGSKARLLILLGYSAENWQQLEAHLRTQHLPCDVAEIAETDWGMRYEIVAPLVCPSGESVNLRSIWQVDIGTDAPRLITMYPE